MTTTWTLYCWTLGACPKQIWLYRSIFITQRQDLGREQKTGVLLSLSIVHSVVTQSISINHVLSTVLSTFYALTHLTLTTIC